MSGTCVVVYLLTPRELQRTKECDNLLSTLNVEALDFGERVADKLGNNRKHL